MPDPDFFKGIRSLLEGHRGKLLEKIRQVQV